MLGPMYEGLNELIVRAWGLDHNLRALDQDEWRRVGIEEVFTFLDIGEQMYNVGTSYHRAFSACKRDLEHFITLLLMVKSEGLHCEHLLDVLSTLQPNDSIISFNWDTIADFTLQLAKFPQVATYCDLMVKRPLVNDFVGRGVLLKLHGSLNWMVCQNLDCSRHGQIRLALRDGQLADLSVGSKCPECGQEERPFIIPPTSRKLIRRGSTMHRLWMLAREQLAFCSRIVFIGYSFPPTDSHSEWLFRQIHFLDEGLPEVIVVNPGIMKTRGPVAVRYSRLFKGRAIHKFATLADFSRDGLELLRSKPGARAEAPQPRLP